MSKGADGLTDQQRRFADGVLKGKTHQDAYRLAGYKATGAAARTGAARLLTNANVEAYLFSKRQQLAEKTDVTVERIVRELARIGFADVRDLFTWSEERAAYVPSRQLTDDQAAAVASVKAKTTRFTREDGTEEERIELELKTYDKLGALEKLGKHLGMFVDRTQNYEFDPDDFSDDGLLRIEKGEDPVHVLVTGGRRTPP